MAGDNGTGTECPVCSSPAVLRCSVCKEVSYCNKEHQKMDWKQHKNACKAYEIQSSERLGRYLVAARDMKPGDIILSETPLVWGPKSLYDPDRLAPCVGCYTPVNIDTGERCNSCGWPICSGHCKGLKDPRHHGVECMVLSLRPGCAVSNIADYYRHDALMTLRCLILQKKFPKKYKKVTDFQSHFDERGPETDIYKETDTLIVKYLQDNFLSPLKSVETELNMNIISDISDKMLHNICGILDVNSLDINLNNGSELSALYHTFCIMEHNCTPNTKHAFSTVSTDDNSQFRITVKAALPIKKGEHITTMYSHALWGTQARREHLKETKYFSCICQRCKDPSELGTNLSGMICLGSGKTPCGGIQLPIDPCNDENVEWSCNKCSIKVPNSEIAYVTSNLGEEVENIQLGRPSILELEELLKKLSRFLHPHHYHAYAVKHSLLQLYGHQYGYLHEELSKTMLDRKSEMCEELLDITKKIDPGNTRLSLYSGVLYHELFQVKFEMLKRTFISNDYDKSAFCKDFEVAIDYLNEAQWSLNNEGDGSPGQKLLAVIKESEKKYLSWSKDNKIIIK